MKRFRSILVGTLIGAAVTVPLVSAAGSDTPTLPNSSDRWIEVTTANFTIFSNASEKTTRTAGANLEQLRSVLASLFGGMKLTSPVPTYIFIFDDLKSFVPYSSYYQGQAKEIAGFFGAGQFANHVAIVSNQYSTDVSSTIYHEYLHYVLRNNRAELPLWINEGLAELYSTFDVGDGVASIGIPITNHIRRLLNSPLIPLSELIAIDHDSPEYNEGSRRGVFYAQSWALTHMMVMGDGGAANRATIYSGFLRSGMDPEDAFLEALGGSYKEIEKELNRYIRGKEFTYSQFAVDSADVGPASITEMAASEILVRLGMLLISLGPERHAFAAEHFRAALAIDENCGPAFAGLGRIDDLAGRIDDAIARYQRAAEIEPDDFMVNILLGSALYTKIAGSPWTGDMTAPTTQARSALQRALALRPSLAEAWAMLGATYTWDDQPEEIGIEALEHALRLLPSRGDVGVNLVLLYVRRDQQSGADSVIARMRTAGVDEQLIRRAEDSTLDFEVRRTDALLRENRIDEALAVLAAIDEATTDPARKEWARQEIRRLQDSQANGAFNDTFNDAVQLINTGKTTEGTVLLEALVNQAPSPGQAAAARELLDRTRAYTIYRAQADEAAALASSGEIEAAIEILEPLLAEAPDSNQAEEISRFLDQLHGYLDFQKHYNEAVDLVNGGDFDAAIAVLQPLIGAAPTPQLAAMASALLEELKEMR